jgi:acetyl-CoA C-acetyltransferase
MVKTARMGANGANGAVLVGVGTATQDAPPGEGADVLQLMIDAVRAAGADAGAPGLLARVRRVLVTQGTWRAADAGRTIARAIGAHEAASVFVQLGIPQQTPIVQAITAIERGEIDVALVVGGEAKARDDRARRSQITLPSLDNPGTKPDDVQFPTSEIIAPQELAIAFVVPVQQYASIDNALGASDSVSIEAHCAQIDTLWSGFDAVAGRNPHAAFAGDRSAADLRLVTPSNRMLAFPYNKWHATQWSVDQAAALMFCSRQVADELGVERELRVHPLVSLESSHSLSLSRREHLHRWPAMHVLGGAAAAHLSTPLRDLELVELYSCFPAAVRVQQRELDLPLDAIQTITGGMAFAGGPFNSFVFQATAAMVRRLRAQPGARGLVSTVSGLLTKPGLAVWSTEASERAPLVGDLAHDAAAATPEREVADHYEGGATVATYTVRTTVDGELEVVVIADTPVNQRVVAVISDADVAARAMHEDLIGTHIRVNGATATT